MIDETMQTLPQYVIDEALGDLRPVPLDEKLRAERDYLRHLLDSGQVADDERWMVEEKLAEVRARLVMEPRVTAQDRASERIRSAYAGTAPRPIVERRPCEVRTRAVVRAPRRDRRLNGGRPRGRRTASASRGSPGGDSSDDSAEPEPPGLAGHFRDRRDGAVAYGAGQFPVGVAAPWRRGERP
ncbi:MAG: hypothetical protein WDZ37_05525 [Solirubrobacterales bacterium]